MLARAFHDDPVFGWFFPAEGSRHRRLRRYFVTELHHESLRHGAVEVACVDGRVAGAAAWFPPGEKHWHGSAPGHPMVHLAVQEADERGEVVTWMEHVSV